MRRAVGRVRRSRPGTEPRRSDGGVPAGRRRLLRTGHGYALAFVERAPLPPHERSWRHPSELAADTRQEIRTERPSRSVRTAALTGGTLTIVLVGAVVLSLTPRGAANPTVAGSTPLPQRITSVALASPATDTIRRSTAAAAAAGTPAPLVETVASARTAAPLATVLDEDGLAVLPSHSVVARLHHGHRGARTTITVTLHDGSTSTASVVAAGDGHGLAVVRVDGPPATTSSFAVAPDVPGDREIVTVLAGEPIEVEMRHLTGGDPDVTTLATMLTTMLDGTAVVDGDGQLVGLLTTDAAGGRLLALDESVTELLAGLLAENGSGPDRVDELSGSGVPAAGDVSTPRD